MDRYQLNIFLLGLSFMLLFTSFQTGGMIQSTIMESIRAHDGAFTVDSFIFMAILYATFSVFNWFAPALVTVLGPRVSMIVSGCTYIFFIANFLFPITWLMYFASVVVGAGAATAWTAQGNYLTLCSSSETISRNSGLFWALFQSSYLWGSVFVFTAFTDANDDKAEMGEGGGSSDGATVKKSTITAIYTVLTILSFVGVGGFFLLSRVKEDEMEDEEEEKPTFSKWNVFGIISESLKTTFGLLITRQMVLLMITSVYIGLQLAFYSVVLGTTIGNSLLLVDSGSSPKRFIGLAGIFIGLGEILGGLVFGLLFRKVDTVQRHHRDPIIVSGYFAHLIAFFLAFINFPRVAPLRPSSDAAFIECSLVVALLCALLLGLGDACYNTQIYSILGVIYSTRSAHAFALYKFFQSIACSAAFYYSASVDLYVQLGILAVTATLGTVTFVHVEWQLRAKLNSV